MIKSLLVVLMIVAAGAAASFPAGRKGEITWKKIVLDREFRSEGVAVADINRDGKPDVLAGDMAYLAPDWKPVELAPIKKFEGEHGYSDAFLIYTADVNGDKWPDEIVIGFPGDKAFWRENPKGKPGYWPEHPIWRSACNESPAFGNLIPGSKPVLCFPFDESQWAWYEPGSDLSKEWICHTISEPKAPHSARFAHGMGIGDINGDGLPDVITPKGYFEAPYDPRSDVKWTPANPDARAKGPFDASPNTWKWVPANLGPDCAQMYVYDVNRDGLPDVISSSSHNIGVWWYEQKKGGEFVQHVIDNSFSQSHSMCFADINGDHLPDIITGKRFWAHGPTGDVNPGDPAVVVWFEQKRSKNGVEWIKHEIDNDSGVGTQFTTADVNKDGLLDVVTSNKKGVYIFLQQRGGR